MGVCQAAVQGPQQQQSMWVNSKTPLQTLPQRDVFPC